MQQPKDEPDQQAARAQKAREKASALYPSETWIQIDPNIYLASQRAPRSEEQAKTLEKELSQARILAALGHTVYLPPESGTRKTKHPDAIVDGLIMEEAEYSGERGAEAPVYSPGCPWRRGVWPFSPVPPTI